MLRFAKFQKITGYRCLLDIGAIVHIESLFHSFDKSHVVVRRQRGHHSLLRLLMRLDHRTWIHILYVAKVKLCNEVLAIVYFVFVQNSLDIFQLDYVIRVILNADLIHESVNRFDFTLAKFLLSLYGFLKRE